MVIRRLLEHLSPGGLLQQAKLLREYAGGGASAPSGGASHAWHEYPLNQQKGKLSVPPAPGCFVSAKEHGVQGQAGWQEHGSWLGQGASKMCPPALLLVA